VPVCTLLLQMERLANMEGSGLIPLLTDNAYDDLGRMYTLFKRVDKGLDLLRKMMGSHITSQGMSLIIDTEKVGLAALACADCFIARIRLSFHKLAAACCSPGLQSCPLETSMAPKCDNRPPGQRMVLLAWLPFELCCSLLLLFPDEGPCAIREAAAGDA